MSPAVNVCNERLHKAHRCFKTSNHVRPAAQEEAFKWFFQRVDSFITERAEAIKKSFDSLSSFSDERIHTLDTSVAENGCGYLQSEKTHKTSSETKLHARMP